MTDINTLSRVYLRVPATAATIAGVDVDPTTLPVEMAVIASGTTVDDTDFHDAIWETIDTVNAAAVLVGPGGSPSIGVFTPEFYDVYVRITDSTEIPVECAGTVRFV